MLAVNDVGEPGAREPHARFDGRELETERLVRVTEVGQPDGKPRASRLRDLPPKPRHRASSRPYTTHHKQAFQPRDPVIAEPGQLPMAGSGLTLAAPYSRLTHLAAAGIQLPLLMTKSRRTSLNSLAIYAKS